MNFKLLFALLALVVGSLTITYASFPVKTTENTTVENVEEVKAASGFAAASGKSQVTALILVLLVGGLGIHRFYLGYMWQGVVQLLTLGGCGIWSLIDLVRIITGDLQPKDGTYSKTL